MELDRISNIASSEDIDFTALNSFIDNQNNYFDDFEHWQIVEAFREAYVGEFDTLKDFVYDRIEEDLKKIPNYIADALDFAAIWESVLRHDYYKIGEHYFRD